MKKSYILDDEISWWVVQTKPQAEFRAIKHLENQGLTTYCPIFKKESIRCNKIKFKTCPLFPSYIFVKVNSTAKNNIHLIRSTLGVKGLVKVGETPAKITCRLINKLRQMELDKFNETKSHFKSGESVKIKTGLYKDIEAIYQMDEGINRAIVLLSMINKETPLNIDKKDIIKL